MKLTIEVEVPDKTVEEMQKFAYACGGYVDISPKALNAVDVFIALYLGSKIDYITTKAEMIDDYKRCGHAEHHETAVGFLEKHMQGRVEGCEVCKEIRDATKNTSELG
jgi:hypothetical protein